MCDVSRYSEFGNITENAHTVSDGDFGKGSVYSESGKAAGMKYNSEGTVTHFDPISWQVHFGVESSMHIVVEWTLAEIDAENTRATQVVNVTMMPNFRPLGVLIEKLLSPARQQRTGSPWRGHQTHRRNRVDHRLILSMRSAIRTASMRFVHGELGARDQVVGMRFRCL
jgi:hypothetical protein